MIEPGEARELCSKSEWELLESSFSPLVETLPLSDLKSRSARIGKLHRKSADLVGLQHSDARKRTTQRKTELFAEAIARCDAALSLLERAHRLEPEPIDADKEKAKEARKLNMDGLQDRADREIESRKTHVLSALAAQGEHRGSPSGAKRIQSYVGSATRRQQAKRDTKD